MTTLAEVQFKTKIKNAKTREEKERAAKAIIAVRIIEEIDGKLLNPLSEKYIKIISLVIIAHGVRQEELDKVINEVES